MNPMLMKLLSLKKDPTPMSGPEKDGKLAALAKLAGGAQDEMGKKLGSLKKVTVASNTPEGLQVGLKKAEDMAAKGDPTDGLKAELGDEEAAEGEEEIKPCDEHSSLEEINAELDRLTALKAEKEAKESDLEEAAEQE